MTKAYLVKEYEGEGEYTNHGIVATEELAKERAGLISCGEYEEFEIRDSLPEHKTWWTSCFEVWPVLPLHSFEPSMPSRSIEWAKPVGYQGAFPSIDPHIDVIRGASRIFVKVMGTDREQVVTLTWEKYNALIRGAE